MIGGGTNLTIAGTVDDTQVTITPSAAIGSHPAGVPFSITLDRGQAVTFHTSVPFLADLSGTRVSATSPISVFGGNTAARIPQDVVAANHLLEQLPPLNAWGRRFLTVPLAGRPGGDTFRIMAQSDHTEVRINGQLVRTLDAGQFDERLLTSASLIEGSAPLLVAQYANSSAFDGAIGDPFMMLVPSYEQYVSDITLSTPSDAFDINFVNLVVPASAIGSVTLDGSPVAAPLFSRIATSDYSSAQIPISVGSHRVRADAPLGVSVYGFAPFDAYGTFGGMALGSIADIRSLTLLPASAELPVGTLHTVTAAVADGNGQPLAGVRIDFAIHGTQDRTQSVVTDRTGRASIQLTSDTAGIDTITASVG
ncbi:MAG: Ig-like domain-containing protein, partial [Aureliella sp.]